MGVFNNPFGLTNNKNPLVTSPLIFFNGEQNALPPPPFENFNVITGRNHFVATQLSPAITVVAVLPSSYVDTFSKNLVITIDNYHVITV
jgi:hypothetical protein